MYTHATEQLDSTLLMITTDRLTLKKPMPADIDRLVLLINDREVSASLSRVPHPYGVSDAKTWLGVAESSPYTFNIYLADALIGGAGLTVTGDGDWELGYWLGKDYWSYGYATEAASGLLEYAKPRLPPQSIIMANVYPSNVGSIGVLKKLAFEQTGSGEVFNVSRDASVSTLVYCLRTT